VTKGLTKRGKGKTKNAWAKKPNTLGFPRLHLNNFMNSKRWLPLRLPPGEGGGKGTSKTIGKILGSCWWGIWLKILGSRDELGMGIKI